MTPGSGQSVLRTTCIALTPALWPYHTFHRVFPLSPSIFTSLVGHYSYRRKAQIHSATCVPHAARGGFTCNFLSTMKASGVAPIQADRTCVRSLDDRLASRIHRIRYGNRLFGGVPGPLGCHHTPKGLRAAAPARKLAPQRFWRYKRLAPTIGVSSAQYANLPEYDAANLGVQTMRAQRRRSLDILE